MLIELFRCSASEALCASTRTELRGLLQNTPDWLYADELFHVDLPHGWADTELDELQWPALIDAVERDRDEVRDLPSDAVRARDIVSRHSLTFDDAVWLIPSSTGIERSAPQGARFERCVQSGDLLLMGEAEGPLTLSSSWRSNDELLLSEGWADPMLKSDRVELPETWLRETCESLLGTDGGLAETNARIVNGLTELGYLPETPAVLAGGYASDSLGRLLQALAVQPHELELYGEQGCVINIGEAVTLSLEHERRVGFLMQSICEALLQFFPTTAEEDEALMAYLANEASHDVSLHRLRQSVASRLSRKRCLAEGREAAIAFLAAPTATATLRRPWHVNIRTSG